MKNKPVFFKPNDVEFLMRAVVFALMVMALLHAFTPYLSDSKAAVSREEVEDLSRQSKLITPAEVVNYLMQSGRPTMLVIYASWCPYCKQMMPDLYSLWQEGKLPGDQMLVVSLDTEVASLSQYLLENRFKSMLGVPIILKAKNKSELGYALAPLGSSFKGGIPYTGFFDKGGKLLFEIHGAAPKAEIEAALANLK